MSAEELLDFPLENQSRRVALWAWVYGRFCRRLAFGTLLLRFGDTGARLYRGPFRGGSAELRIRRPLRLLARLLTRGEIGFAEAYMARDWSTPDLPALLDFLNLNAEHLAGAVDGAAWSRRLDRLAHRLRDNDRRNSRRNIARHYDLGNDFYRLWLDPGMTYSSAVFEDPALEPLESAQARKYERLLDWVDARPGESVLEIGCGWGGFAEAAARRGLRVTGVTLSKEQLAHAQARIAAAGLGARVELRLQDYRDIRGRFDHAVSIEMLEAVGEEYWPTYFQVLRRLVRPGGRIAIQVITLHEDDFPRYRRCADFIQLYIFPGGMLPSPDRLDEEVRAVGLIPLASRWHGADYAETLRRWRRAFHAAEGQVERLGYDARFRRMWDYYLAYCEAGFDSGSIDLAQVLLQVPEAGPEAA
jgi:cyclopropane-fatty-acyl-phospholipid synthase